MASIFKRNERLSYALKKESDMYGKVLKSGKAARLSTRLLITGLVITGYTLCVVRFCGVA